MRKKLSNQPHLNGTEGLIRFVLVMGGVWRIMLLANSTTSPMGFKICTPLAFGRAHCLQ